jgi:general stress protein 26
VLDRHKFLEDAMADDIDRVWELMKKISICMLASWDGHELHARPMGAYVRREDDAIYFLTDARHHKDQDIARYPKVCLAFADTSGQKYVSLAGVTGVSSDRGKIRELWGTPAWCCSNTEPNSLLLRKPWMGMPP